MTTKKIIIAICMMMPILPAFSQTTIETPFFERKNEIGINATQMLSNLLSLNSGTTSNTPFGFHYAYNAKGFTIRMGANLFYKQVNENSGPMPGNPSGLRLLADHTIGGRLCLEKQIPIMKRVNFHVGIDGIIQNIHDESIINGQFFTSNNTLNVGGGPAARLLFKINKHLNLMTETTLYGNIGYSEKRIQLGTPNVEISNSKSQSAELSLPTKMYIQMLF